MYPALGGGEWTFVPYLTPIRVSCEYRPNLLWKTSPGVTVIALRKSRVMKMITRSPTLIWAREWNVGCWITGFDPDAEAETSVSAIGSIVSVIAGFRAEIAFASILKTSVLKEWCLSSALTGYRPLDDGNVM
jgi:hypothetical protein